MFTIDEQIECIRRELASRKKRMPKLIELGHFSQADASNEIALMTQVLETLCQLRGIVTLTTKRKQGEVSNG